MSSVTGGNRKRVDDRINTIVTACSTHRHRSLFIVVGDRGKEQVATLHTLVSRAQHIASVSVLWCMKDTPLYSGSKKKRRKQEELEVKAGVATEASAEAFEAFHRDTDIRYCQYKETHKVLGNTYGMLVLQDFESLTPNIIARTVETVAGGGMIILMIRSVSALKQLHTLVMDVHARYRTELHKDVTPRFNERFLLSLSDCTHTLCVDDDLNVLPITEQMKSLTKIQHLTGKHDSIALLEGKTRKERELGDIKSKLGSNSVVGPLVQQATTVDQAKMLLSLMESVAEKTLRTTCVITAARGRGKSATLGLTVAGAISQGYSNIFVTSPSPENLGTFFEFVVKGLLAMGYKDREQFEVQQSTVFSKAIIRVDVFRDHRQTVAYVAPQSSDKFGQAELLVIDEAAALPLPLVQKMMGPYLTFLSSTVSGYEGTGRSLSLKLVHDLRQQKAAAGPRGGRNLKELQMTEPIRYGEDDPVEGWLTGLLCLDATNMKVPPKTQPHPSKCELYYVNRDALFSYHPVAEKLLQRIVSLLVAAHYKNQPNDIQLMSDAPAHHVFVLTNGNLDVKTAEDIPDIFCVIHACEEGGIDGSTMQQRLNTGLRPSGDLVPYTISQHYQEVDMARFRGLRVVRIATNPEVQRAGYGTRALQLLNQYAAGRLSDMSAAAGVDNNGVDTDAGVDDALKKKKTPHLLVPLSVRPPEPIDYLSTSFGITGQLFGFWSKNGFDVVYIRQQPSDVTGEHSAVMVAPVKADGFDQTVNFRSLKNEFQSRYLWLLSQCFRGFPVDLALSIATDLSLLVTNSINSLISTDGRTGGLVVAGVKQASFSDVLLLLSESDIARLERFASATVEFSVILDALPRLAHLYFGRKFVRSPDGSAGVALSMAQSAVLLAVGLQGCRFEELGGEGGAGVFSGVEPQQLRAFLSKATGALVEHIRKLQRTQPARASSKKASPKLGSADATGNEPLTVRQAGGQVTGATYKQAVPKSVPSTDSTLMRSVTKSSSGKVDTGMGIKKKLAKKRNRD